MKFSLQAGELSVALFSMLDLRNRIEYFILIMKFPIINSLRAAVVALVFAITPSVSNAKTARQKVPGQIVAINKKANSLTIHESANKDVKYSVSSQTRVFVNGKKSTVSHLSTKMKVAVTHPSGSTTLDHIDAHTLVKPKRHRRH